MIYNELDDVITALMNLKHRPDAIFSPGDRLTVSCIRTLKKLKIEVPDDIAIVGFSNSTMGELMSPSLTAVKHPAFEMGQIATELLITLIESKRPVTVFEKIVLQTETQVRDSFTRKAKKSKSSSI